MGPNREKRKTAPGLARCRKNKQAIPELGGWPHNYGMHKLAPELWRQSVHTKLTNQGSKAGQSSDDNVFKVMGQERL